MRSSSVLLLLSVALTLGCAADGATNPVNNASAEDMGVDADDSQNNRNNTGSNNKNNSSNNDNEDMGADMGEDMPVAKPTMPTTIVPTSGGGTAGSADHRLTITVGTPQPHGIAGDSDHRLLLGPIIPTE